MPNICGLKKYFLSQHYYQEDDILCHVWQNNFLCDKCLSEIYNEGCRRPNQQNWLSSTKIKTIYFSQNIFKPVRKDTKKNFDCTISIPYLVINLLFPEVIKWFSAMVIHLYTNWLQLTTILNVALLYYIFEFDKSWKVYFIIFIINLMLMFVLKLWNHFRMFDVVVKI